MKHLKCILWIIVFGAAVPAMGQLKPVSVALNIAPPTSVYLSDFSTAGSQRLTLLINQNDENEPVLDVAFNLSIEGNGILLQSDPNFPFQPFAMDFGMNSLSGFDLDQYLNLANMIISGADPTEIIQTGSLPEGMYTFCIEVTDYLRRDKVISQQSCSMTTLLKNNPPQTVFPECASTIPFTGTQNVQFSWQANHDLSIQSEYTIKIVEVPPNVNPNDAINGAGTPILEDYSVSNTNFLYDQTFVDLEIGKTYAYRIDVEDLMGLTTFENDGIGEVCWFIYGAEGGGTIALTSPANDSQINSSGSVLLVWNNPSNSNPTDELYYKIKLVEIEGGQTAQEAMAINPTIILEETEIVNPSVPYNYAIEDGILEMEKNYAWQIESYIGDQMTAISEVWTLVSAPLLSSFSAAGKTVTVTSTNGGTDPSNLSGIGHMKLSEEGPDIPIIFEGLNVGVYPSGNILEEGTIVSPLDNYAIDYSSDDMPGLAFEASDIVLTSSDLKLRGRLAWSFPHPTISGEIPTIYSEIKDMYFQEYVLDGTLHLEEGTYTLADPIGLKININDESNIQLTGEEAITALSGTITLPSNIKDSEDEAVTYDFDNEADLYSIVLPGISNGEKIKLFEESNIYLRPTKVIFDFDEIASVTPDDAIEEWKGIFFEQFEIVFDEDLDAQENLIVHASEYVYEFEYNENVVAKIGETGLTMSSSYAYASDYPEISFRTFPGKLKEWTIDFLDGYVSNTSEYIGEIFIEVFGADAYGVRSAISSDGIMPGQIIGSLEGTVIESSGGEYFNELEITLINTYMGGPDYIVGHSNFNWLNLECIDGGTGGVGFEVPNFRIYGNGNIGIAAPNTPAPLNHVGSAKLDELYNIDVDSIYAGKGEDGYVYAMIGSLALGTDVAGDDGPPPIEIQAQSPADDDADDSSDDSSQGSQSSGWKGAFVNSIQIPAINIHIPGLFKVASQGVQYSDADTLWGSCFKANLIVDIYKPKKVGLTAKLVTGVTVAGTTYLFLEGSIGGTSLDGIPDSLKVHYQNFDGSAGNQNPNLISIDIAETVRIHKFSFKFYKNIIYQEGYVGGVKKYTFFPTDTPSMGGGLGISMKDILKNGDFLDVSFGGWGIGSSNADFNFGIDLSAKVMKDAKMGGSIVYTSNPKRFIGTAFLELKKPVCIKVNGGVDMNFDTKNHKFKLGSKANKILLMPYPNCIGIGVNGWVNVGTYFGLDSDPDLDSLDLDFGVGAIAQVQYESDWINTPVFDLQFIINGGANLGIQAKLAADLDPELEVDMKAVGGWFDAWIALVLKINSVDGLEEYNLGSAALAASFLANMDEDEPLSPYWDATVKVTFSFLDLDWKFTSKWKEMPFD